MSGALNTFLAGTANLLEGASKVISRGTLRLFIENLQVFFSGFIHADKKPTEEYKKALAINAKLLIRQVLQKGSNDVKEVLIDAFGADLGVLEQDSSPDVIMELVWAAFRKPNAKAAGEIKAMIGAIKLVPTSLEFRGNYQRLMQLFVEHDDVAEQGKTLSNEEKLLFLMRALGNSFVEQFVMTCSLSGKEVSYPNLKKVLDDLLKIRFEHKLPAQSGMLASEEEPIRRSFIAVPKAKYLPKAAPKVFSKPLKCFRCGASSHLANTCPHKDKTCNSCGGNHLKLMCNKQTAQMAVGEFAFLSENENFIDLDKVNATPIYVGENPTEEFADFPDFELGEAAINCDTPSSKRQKVANDASCDEDELVDYEEDSPKYC